MKVLKPQHLTTGSTLGGQPIALLGDIPTTLPATGGNSDTVDGKHASDFAPIAHVGAGGVAHALATTTIAGFMSGPDKTKMDGIQANAINQTTSDARYIQQTGGNLTGPLTFGNRFGIQFNSSTDSLQFTVI